MTLLYVQPHVPFAPFIVAFLYMDLHVSFDGIHDLELLVLIYKVICIFWGYSNISFKSKTRHFLIISYYKYLVL